MCKLRSAWFSTGLVWHERRGYWNWVYFSTKNNDWRRYDRRNFWDHRIFRPGMDGHTFELVLTRNEGNDFYKKYFLNIFYSSILIMRNINDIPLRFRKAGRMWCGGARETHWATCFSPANFPAFFDLHDTIYDMLSFENFIYPCIA